MDFGYNFDLKPVGFIWELNAVEGAIKLLELPPSSSDGNSVSDVISYLETNNNLVLGWMGYFSNPEDGSLICEDAYYTDGVYFWPGYFPYFLKKYPRWELPIDFVNQVKRTNDVIKLSEEELLQFEDVVAHYLDGNGLIM